MALGSRLGGLAANYGAAAGAAAVHRQVTDPARYADPTAAPSPRLWSRTARPAMAADLVTNTGLRFERPVTEREAADWEYVATRLRGLNLRQRCHSCTGESPEPHLSTAVAPRVIARLLDGLPAVRIPQTINDYVASTLDDSTVEVLFWSEQTESLVDADGGHRVVPRDGAPGPRLSEWIVGGGDRRIALLSGQANSASDPASVAPLVRVLTLVAENARLNALLRKRLVELTATRIAEQMAFSRAQEEYATPPVPARPDSVSARTSRGRRGAHAKEAAVGLRRAGAAPGRAAAARSARLAVQGPTRSARPCASSRRTSHSHDSKSDGTPSSVLIAASRL